jgi:hypothetical protein
MKGGIMPEQTKKTTAPKNLIGLLDYWLVKKAPFQIPENAKEWIVKFGPWIDLVLLVLFLPALLAMIGFTSFLTPYAMMSGVTYSTWYWLGLVVLVAQLGLQVAALPGLFARKMSGWTLLFYSQIVSLVYSIVSGNILGALISAIIGLYFLFQIRTKYAK